MTEYIVEVSDFVIDAHGKSPFEGHEEIVRCRDCKHCKRREGILPPTVCERWGYYNFKTEPYRFCAWGERRSDGQL